jgi:outer membrane protein insertion porin family
MTKNVFYFIFFVLFATSCSTTKYLPEGELLYVGGKIKVDNSLISKKEHKLLKSKLTEILRPKPNKKFLGLRPRLFIFNLVGTVKKEKGFRHWLKYKVGEATSMQKQLSIAQKKLKKW